MKKLPNYLVFTFLAIAFLFGIGLATFLNISWEKSWQILLLIIVLLLASGLMNLYLKNRPLVFTSWIFLILALGFSWYIFYNQKSEVKINYGEIQTFSGTVVRQPDKDYKQQKIIIKTNDFNIKTNILVNAPRYPDLSYGDQVKISGKIEKPGKIEDFNYGNYLKRFSVFSVVYQPQGVEKIGEKRGIIVLSLRWLYQIPSIFEGAINQVLVEPQASLAGGLLFGSKRSIPEELQNNLKNTGLTHIIALSGYNITIIVDVLALILARYFGKRRAFWLGLASVAFFVLITGAASSVLRAAVFSILIIYGKLLGRRGNQTNLMLLAAVVILFFNPYLLIYDIGFQLSFGAFAGLIYLSPVIGAILEQSRLKYFPIYIKAPLTETLSAQIMVLPLLLVYFGVLSFISPVANVLVLWIIPISMLLSLGTAIGVLIWWPFGKLVSFLTWPVLSYITAISKILANVPLASTEIENFNFALALASYALIFFVYMIIKKRYKRYILSYSPV